MPFQYDLLQILVNPNVAYLLLLVGLDRARARALQPRQLILPGALGADLAAARPLRHRPAAGRRRRRRPAGRRRRR